VRTRISPACRENPLQDARFASEENPALLAHHALLNEGNKLLVRSSDFVEQIQRLAARPQNHNTKHKD
jgi:hypothetical protein